MSVYPGSLLRPGSVGPAVAEVQSALHVVGDFGPATTAAVKAYQVAHGLSADGVVGPLTWLSLFPPVDPPVDPPIPPIALPLWAAWTHGGITNGWKAEQQLVREEQQKMVTFPARKGFPFAAMFNVRPGDFTSGDTGRVRSEVYASVADTGNAAPGQTMWFGGSFYGPNDGSFYVETNDKSPGGNGWGILTQWHGDSMGGNPNVVLGLTKGTPPQLLIGTKGDGGVKEWRVPLRLGVWNDWKARITWSNGTTGHLLLKLNEQVVVDAACSNLYAGLSTYLKQGWYGSTPAAGHTITIYHCGTRRGLTEASVTLPPQ